MKKVHKYLLTTQQRQSVPMPGFEGRRAQDQIMKADLDANGGLAVWALIDERAKIRPVSFVVLHDGASDLTPFGKTHIGTVTIRRRGGAGCVHVFCVNE